MPNELLTNLATVQANARRLVEGVAADQWDSPTPCSEWNVRQLVNHMGFTNRILGAAALGQAPTFGPDDDHVGADAPSGFAARSASNELAWGSDGALDGTVGVPFEMPSTAALTVNVLDIGIHCWDLASATNQDHGLTADLIAAIDAGDRAIINADIRASGGFGEELQPGSDDALTSMLAFVGRRA